MRILRKLLRGAAVLALSAAALAVSSCSGISERSDDSPSGAARVRLGGASVSSSRTLLSSFNQNDYIYQLTAKKGDTELVLKAGGTTDKASSDEYTELKALKEASWSLDVGTWTFTLNAKNAEKAGDVVLTGEKKDVKLTEDNTQSLDFVMKALAKGTASLSVTLDFSEADDWENVASVKAFLTEKFLLEPADADTDGKVFTTVDDTLNDGMVTFESDVPAGVTRYLTFFLFDGENNVIGYYSTAVFAFKDTSITETLTLKYLVPIDDGDDENYPYIVFKEDFENLGKDNAALVAASPNLPAQMTIETDEVTGNSYFQFKLPASTNGRNAYVPLSVPETGAYRLVFDAALVPGDEGGAAQPSQFAVVTADVTANMAASSNYLLALKCEEKYTAGAESYNWTLNDKNNSSIDFAPDTFYTFVLSVDNEVVTFAVYNADKTTKLPTTTLVPDGSSRVATRINMLIGRSNTSCQRLDNIIVKSAEVVTPGATVTAKPFSVNSYVPAQTTATVRLTGTTSFTALPDNTNVSHWFKGLPDGFNAKLSGSVADGGIRAKVLISGMLESTEGEDSDITVSVPAGVLHDSSSALDAGTINCTISAGGASATMTGSNGSNNNIELGTKDAEEEYSYTITLTNNSFLASVTKDNFTVKAGGGTVTVKSVIVDEDDLTKATVTISVKPASTAEKGKVTLTIAADALANNTALSIETITYEYTSGVSVRLISPAEATVSFSATGRSVGDRITVIKLSGTQTAKAIFVDDVVATIIAGSSTAEAKALSALDAGATEIPVYFLASDFDTLGVELASGIAQDDVEKLEPSADYRGCAYVVTFAEDFDDYTKFEFVNTGTSKNVLRGTKSDESTVDVMFTVFAEASTSTTAQKAVLEVADDETHGNYVYLWNSNGKGPRGAHTNQDLGLSNVADYYVEFDASVSASSVNSNSNGPDPQPTYLTLMTNNASSTNNTPSENYLFMLKHDSANEINTTNSLTSTFKYFLNDKDESLVSLANGRWYHFVIHVANETVTLSITDGNGVVIEDTNGVAVTDRELEVEGTSYTATSIDLNVGKGYRAFVKLDNIMTYTTHH